MSGDRDALMLSLIFNLVLIFLTFSFYLPAVYCFQKQGNSRKLKKDEERKEDHEKITQK